MRNAILMTLCSIIAISAVVIGITFISTDDLTETTEPAQSIAQNKRLQTGEGEYLLKAYEGKLGMFTKDLVVPDMVFEVYMNCLPDYDQEQLERGIRLSTYEELVARIEDYIS